MLRMREPGSSRGDAGFGLALADAWSAVVELRPTEAAPSLGTLLGGPTSPGLLSKGLYGVFPLAFGCERGRFNGRTNATPGLVFACRAAESGRPSAAACAHAFFRVASWMKSSRLEEPSKFCSTHRRRGAGSLARQIFEVTAGNACWEMNSSICPNSMPVLRLLVAAVDAGAWAGTCLPATKGTALATPFPASSGLYGLADTALNGAATGTVFAAFAGAATGTALFATAGL
mmetsp:Transcript_8969/g.21485  ORF Transcript_8969/g.21485 Transcript_8969/m.21485 type:complete len:231 (-) Transcript_8969:434-1126(-)